jgi:uncharacterized membrane protein SpoIIM required for sporulation
MRYVNEVRSVFARSKILIGIVTVVFFSVMVVSAVVSYVLLVSSPQVMGYLRDFMASERGLIGIPPPGTSGFYRLIFLNNIGHFWNPIRAWVWLPFVGAFSLGYELLLNAIIIGGVISFATLTKGAAFTIAGLTPHGVFEIPAFILEFAGLTRWHVATSRAIYGKMSGRQVDRPLFIEGVKDTFVLSLFSVTLFAVAAYVETFITPVLIGH